MHRALSLSPPPDVGISPLFSIFFFFHLKLLRTRMFVTVIFRRTSRRRRSVRDQINGKEKKSGTTTAAFRCVRRV